MKTNDGGPAFPTNLHDWQEQYVGGATLRDYFAAKAMQGWLSNPNASEPTRNANAHAIQAYVLADAMLNARENSDAQR